MNTAPTKKTTPIVLLENRRVRHDYTILQEYRAGMVLRGWEVKSLREKRANIRAAWVKVREEGAWLENCQIYSYPHAQTDMNEGGARKLLLTKKELRKLLVKTKETGVTVALLNVLVVGRYLKCTIGLVRGKRQYEKRQKLKERTIDREAARAMKR